jgi:hypothetical protein
MFDLTDCHASAKTDCFVAELDSDNNEMKNETDSFNISQLVNLMSSFF